MNSSSGFICFPYDGLLNRTPLTLAITALPLFDGAGKSLGLLLWLAEAPFGTCMWSPGEVAGVRSTCLLKSVAMLNSFETKIELLAAKKIGAGKVKLTIERWRGC
jgi:hypothetical protein